MKKKLYNCGWFIVATSREQALQIYIDHEFGEDFGQEVKTKYIYCEGNIRIPVSKLIEEETGLIESVYPG